MLIDSHCHLTSAVLYARLHEVLERAAGAGITRLITIATSAADARQAVSVADHFPGVFATVGIHPHEAGKVRAEDWRCLRELRHHPRVVAWGEIGLDYHYDFAEPPAQREVFARQLEMACAAGLPVVVHCREAVADVLEMLAPYRGRLPGAVFHCFTGTAGEADDIARQGWRLSFTGIVTFRNSAALQAVAARYPLDQLMLETDAPYLSPEPHRKVRPNEPALLVHTARFLAELHGQSLEALARKTSANTCAFFNLPADGGG